MMKGFQLDQYAGSYGSWNRGEGRRGRGGAADEEKNLVGTIILKIFLGLIFIGSATGAIVYAVINSEESQNQPIDENATLYFPYDIDQQCFNGTLTMQYRIGVQNGQEQYSYNYYGTDWVQDATKKRLYHRVGLTTNDWQYSYYVFEDVTFFQTKKRCTKMEQGYADFIEGFFVVYRFRTISTFAQGYVIGIVADLEKWNF
ncbi:hypothetical protein Y032_0046g1390 [Ancylostoma ceylanicum]|nr:hypothetical protein Y032_0046g1390 [Ancylostoma ceylanicum]